jgi:hypothetical protein
MPGFSQIIKGQGREAKLTINYDQFRPSPELMLFVIRVMFDE